METDDQVVGSVRIKESTAEGRLSRGRTVFDVIRWTSLLLWLLVLAAAVTLGSRITPLSDLEFDVNAGDVTSVAITPGMPPGAEGVAMQSVFWRSGFLNHRADVVMVTPGQGASEATFDEDVAVRDGHDIAERLGVEHPSLLITQVPERLSSAQVFGFDVPLWLLGFALPGIVGTLMVLVSGPQPWRATRWAWFWILSTGIGPPLFLILAGPTPPLPPPRERHRRLTGGWALLVTVLLQPLLQL